MSYSKRILFGDDPADDAVRAQLREQTRQFLEPLVFKIPTRRKNRSPGPHWDPRWRWALHQAVKELAIQTANINDQVCVRSKADADAIKTRAQALYEDALRQSSHRIT